MDSRYRYKPRDETRIQLDELLETADNVMTQMRSQRETFRSMDNRFRQIDSTLGMSSSVMRLIDRRFYTDRLLLFGGMILFTLFMIVIYFYYL